MNPPSGSVKGVYVFYGPTFANSVDLNNLTTWRCITASTMDGVEQEIVLLDTVYSHPYEERIEIKERVFSIRFEAVIPPGQGYYKRWLFAQLDDLKKKLYSGPLRVVFARGVEDPETATWFYLDCRIETVQEVSARLFEAKFVAADPFFRWFDWGNVSAPSNITLDMNALDLEGAISTPGQGRVRMSTMLTGEDVDVPDAGIYVPQPVDYPGTAPAEPIYLFQIGGRGGIWRYYRDITVTNNCPYPLRNYPICIDLGNLSAAGLVGDPTNPGATPSAKFWESSHTDHKIKDIRIEGPGGDRKPLFVRDSGERGGTWHQSVKVWHMLYVLEPGASVTLRVLYGNVNALASELYPEQSSIKPMFNLYDSTNTTWIYSDFMPLWNLPQTRAFQWSAYIPPHDNITWIGFPHPAFDNLTGGVNVACAGAKVQYHAPASGAGGLQVVFPVGVASVSYTVRFSVNDKTPFLIRWQRRNGEWVDSLPGEPGFHSDASSVANATISITAEAEWTTVDILPGSVAFTVGMGILIPLEDGTRFRTTLTDVDPTFLTLADPIPTGHYAPAGGLVSGFKTLTSQTKSFPSNDYPLTIACILRGDHPEWSSGQWYFGGVEAMNVNFSSTEKPSVTAWASATEVDLLALNKYQLIGRFGNSGTGEFLRINTITHNIRDVVIVDCANRRVWYIEWDPVANRYKVPVSRIEALTFEAVRFYWVHLDPFAANDLNFVHDANSNFRDLDAWVIYPILYY